MRKVSGLLLVLLLCISTLKSQSYIGFLNDNYSGVHGIISNPANIVDSRFKTDINIIGVNIFANNDYAGVKLFDILKDGYDFNKSGNKFIKDNNNGRINLDILGPSFMLNILPKHSIAFSTRVRAIGGANDINGNTIKLIDENFDSSEAILANEGNIDASVNMWGEFGATYATVLMDKGNHFLKGGITLKYLQGIGTASANGKSLKVAYDEKTSNEINTSGELTYSYSSNFENKFEDFELQKNSTGFSSDIGFIYEWRPEIEKYKYKNTEGKEALYKDENKYKLKLGLSFTDLFGSISYKNTKNETYNVTASFTEEQFDKYDGINDKLNGLFTIIKTTNTNKAYLPTALHFNADWNINNSFYVNLDTNFDIAGNKENTSKISNTYILTPRFEKKWFSAYLPMGIYEFSGFNAGFGFRAGPLYAGSGSILTNLFSDNSKAADVYIGLKIPIYQSKPKDRDNDGVFDEIDNCPKVAGPIENNGCPWGDKDNDTVLDNVDKCIDVKGDPANNGCPWGDKDNDTVLDNVDKCPTEAGPADNDGCPKDTDKDGVLDKDDECPTEAGYPENKGCPDADGDSVIDKNDKCPKVAGVPENNGCPEVKIISKEDAKKLSDFAKAIYFNSGKNTFKPGVTEKLDLIVNIMEVYKGSRFQIEGHTDSQGSNASNLSLSKKRAKAVLDYLVRNGIAPSRLTSNGFGEDYPIATNNTRQGRAQNRRVEIKLIK